MDCDKFEDVMLDELYGELDELTSAAAKRHLAGCARCSALLAGLRATRRVLALPSPSPSDGFEDRLLAAVREAETHAKPAHGLAELISLAGRWAMRPQTAMAAVFLLMVTTTSIVFTHRAPRSGVEAAPASFTVTENGSPAASAAAPVAQADEVALDPRAAAAAHGPAGPAARASGPAAAAAKALAADGVLQTAPSAEGALASADERRLDDKEKEPYAVAHSAKRGAPSALGSIAGGGLANSQAADLSPPVAPAAAAAPGFAVPPPPKDNGTGGALAAARAERDTGGGCAAAAPELDAVAASAWGTQAGYDATFEGAQCYARLGQSEAARSRFTRLLTVPAYAYRAQAGINATSMVAAKARAVSAKPAAPAAAPATPPAAVAPAPPPSIKK